MSKIIKIKPVDIPNKGLAVTLTITVKPFEAFDTSVSVNFGLCDSNDIVLSKGTVVIPPNIVDEWTTDDTVIVNYVADTQALTIISITDAPVVVKAETETIQDRLKKIQEAIIASRKAAADRLKNPTPTPTISATPSITPSGTPAVTATPQQ